VVMYILLVQFSVHGVKDGLRLIKQESSISDSRKGMKQNDTKLGQARLV
jgi:hypothetical protein